jgi:hypothetical protein
MRHLAVYVTPYNRLHKVQVTRSKLGRERGYRRWSPTSDQPLRVNVEREANDQGIT